MTMFVRKNEVVEYMCVMSNVVSLEHRCLLRIICVSCCVIRWSIVGNINVENHVIWDCVRSVR